MFESLHEFHFIRPWWLVLLVAIPILIFLQQRFKQNANSWRKVISADLYSALIEQSSDQFRRSIAWLPILCIVLTSLSLAGPSYQRLPQPVEVVEDPLVIVLDLTLSMTSDDVKPTRIERAKFKITDILRLRSEGSTGLVAFAGDAYVVTPLTKDSETIQNLLNSLTPQMMPIKGSNLPLAIKSANDLLSHEEGVSGRILLITDGLESLAATLREIDSSYPISVLGVRGDLNDAVTLSSNVDIQKLRDFASLAGGQYRTVTFDDSDIEQLLRRDFQFDTTLLDDTFFDTWHDLGYLLLIPLVLVLAVITRKGGLLLVFIVICIQPVQANWLNDLWKTKEQQAVDHYREGDFESASGLLEQQNSTTSTYNLGNSLAMQGMLQEAIKAYDEVLASSPNHDDAAFNKKVLEEFLQQQQNQQQENQSQEQQENQDDQSSGQEDSQQSQTNQSESDSSDSSAQQEQDNQGQPESEQEQNQSEPADPNEDAESSESEGTMAQQEESQSEREQRDMHERWLRRVPDDPGNLLESKFRVESNKKIQEGELDRRDLGPAW